MTSKLLEQDTSAEKLYILNEYVSSHSLSSDPMLPKMHTADARGSAT